MTLKPHILHVVGHTEAHHAATAEDIIEACKIAQRSIENALDGQPDMTFDPAVQKRKAELISEANITLEAIRSLSGPGQNPFTDPGVLSMAVSSGILDAPQLINNPFACGKVVTRIDKRGACVVIDPENGNMLRESKRIAGLQI
jgi:hypothetical protein